MSRAYFSSSNTDYTHSHLQQSRLGSDDHWDQSIAPANSNTSTVSSNENVVTQSRLTTPLSTNALPSPSNSYNAQRNNSKAGALEHPALRDAKRAMDSIVSLKKFLLTAPRQFDDSDIIRQFRLPNEQISCVRWDQMFFITGTDIVRCILHRFAIFGRNVTNRKKFEEGIFSDLRNLKINVDAVLENPKSELLEFLYKRNCVRTKKKQKVFFWFSVRHEQLFIDALERDLKKESAYHGLKNISGVRSQSEDYMRGSQASTVALREPALSFRYDSTIPLAEQIPGIVRNMPAHLAAIVDETTSARLPETRSTKSQSPDVAVLGNADSAARGPATPTENRGDHFPKGIHGQKEMYPMSPLQNLDNEVSGPNAYYTTHSLNHNEIHYALENRLDGTNYELIKHNSKFPARQHPAWPQHNAAEMLRSVAEDNAYAIQTHQTHIPSLSRELFSKYTTTEQHPEHERCHSQTNWPGPQDSHVDKSVNNDRAVSNKDTDFPLDFLNSRDHSFRHSFGGSLFEAEFTDFAYHNRPAVLSETNEYTEVDAHTSILGAPLETGNADNRLPATMPSRSRSLYPSNLTSQPSMWDQSLIPEAVESSQDAYKSASRGSNWTRGLPAFRFPDNAKPSMGPLGGVHKASSFSGHPSVHGR